MKLLFLFLGILTITLFSSCDKLTDPEEKKEIYLGFAVGDSGKVYKSTNGGVNWLSVQTGISSKLNSVFVFNEANVIAVGNNGIIIKTADGGITWNVQQSGTTVNLNKIIFNNQTNQIWIAGDEGTLLMTNNY